LMLYLGYFILVSVTLFDFGVKSKETFNVEIEHLELNGVSISVKRQIHKPVLVFLICLDSDCGIFFAGESVVWF